MGAGKVGQTFCMNKLNPAIGQECLVSERD